MREIKFDLIYKGETGFHHKKYHLCELMRGINKICDIHQMMELIVTRQCTGLKDKNGVEIYEGDILANKSLYDSQGFGAQVIEREKKDINKCFGHGSFGDNAFSGFEISSYYGQPRDLEVIGNIYENPELMRRSKRVKSK